MGRGWYFCVSVPYQCHLHSCFMYSQETQLVHFGEHGTLFPSQVQLTHSQSHVGGSVMRVLSVAVKPDFCVWALAQHFLSAWRGHLSSVLTSLCLGFLVCKTKITVVPTSMLFWGLKKLVYIHRWHVGSVIVVLGIIIIISNNSIIKWRRELSL